jgi:hypothetical protein
MAESTDRRRFLSRCAATLAASLAGKSVGFAESHSYSGRSAGKVRSAVHVRTRAALQDEDLRVVKNTGNSDEMLYPFKIGSYHKGLPHNAYTLSIQVGEFGLQVRLPQHLRSCALLRISPAGTRPKELNGRSADAPLFAFTPH